MNDSTKPAAPEAAAKPAPAPAAKAPPASADALKSRRAMAKANASPKVAAIRAAVREQTAIKTSTPAPPTRRIEHRKDGSEVRPYTRTRKPKG